MSSSGDEDPRHDRSLSGSKEEFSSFEGKEIPLVGANVEIESEVHPLPKVTKTIKRLFNPLMIKIKSKQKKPKSKAQSKPPKKKAKKNTIDLDKLTSEDVANLKKKLGLGLSTGLHPENYDDESFFQPDYEDFEGLNQNRPNLRVQIDADDISDSELSYRVNQGNFVKDKNMSQNMLKALFGDDLKENTDPSDNEWSMPKLKSVVKGDPVASSLASLINTACISQCDVEGMISKYSVPQNCDKLCPPLINSEIWKILDKKPKSYDRMLVDIQNLVATGVTSIIKLVGFLKEVMSKNENAKQTVLDALTLFGQVQYHLSLRRRYLLKPNLKKKYRNLCSQSTPISSQLFGDDIAKEIKNCDAGVSISSRLDQFSRPFRGRGFYRGNRGRRFHPYSYGGYASNQSQTVDAYYQPWQPRAMYRRGARGRGRPSATLSAPNEQN